MVSHNINLCFYYSNLGNEALMDEQGLGIGTFLCLNAGSPSHSNLLSTNGGMSKATVVALCFLVYPKPVDQPMSYQECFYPLDMLQIKKRFIPVIAALCHGLDEHFWVSRS